MSAASGNNSKIDDLIQQTKDPVQQATLLVLSNIDHALFANTKATLALADDFAVHKTEFREHKTAVDNHIATDRTMMASIRGAWWAGVILVTGLQLLGGLVIANYIKANEKQDERLDRLVEQYVQQQNRLIMLEYTVNKQLNTPGR